MKEGGRGRLIGAKMEGNGALIPALRRRDRRNSFPMRLRNQREEEEGRCNIPSFQKSEKSKKFKTFSNYMYFILKRNFMHCMHHHLDLVCICLHLVVQKIGI